ncbi:hypothetical protein FA15DRAFT_748167 [Coprinopsis marcescibilis]|uniref:Uncharacterized protein n=1 Tax=Coprinopsis marcescibilis TaxID=230819 RepID=A0A5C3KS24_COPMA|nr:hypothetical protein FA15DRAFT_748167 [Coprinopsis marcescibilis]
MSYAQMSCHCSYTNLPNVHIPGCTIVSGVWEEETRSPVSALSWMSYGASTQQIQSYDNEGDYQYMPSTSTVELPHSYDHRSHERNLVQQSHNINDESHHRHMPSMATAELPHPHNHRSHERNLVQHSQNFNDESHYQRMSSMATAELSHPYNHRSHGPYPMKQSQNSSIGSHRQHTLNTATAELPNQHDHRIHENHLVNDESQFSSAYIGRIQQPNYEGYPMSAETQHVSVGGGGSQQLRPYTYVPLTEADHQRISEQLRSIPILDVADVYFGFKQMKEEELADTIAYKKLAARLIADNQFIEAQIREKEKRDQSMPKAPKRKGSKAHKQ